MNPSTCPGTIHHCLSELREQQPIIICTFCSGTQRSTKGPTVGPTMDLIQTMKTTGMSPCLSVSVHAFVISISSPFCLFVYDISGCFLLLFFILMCSLTWTFLFLLSYNKHLTTQTKILKKRADQLTHISASGPSALWLKNKYEEALLK